MNCFTIGFRQLPDSYGWRDNPSRPEFRRARLDLGPDAFKLFVQELISGEQFNIGHRCQWRHASAVVSTLCYASHSGQHGWADARAAQPARIRNLGHLQVGGMLPLELSQDRFSHPCWEEFERKRLV